MNHFYLAANIDKDPELKESMKICSYLKEHGAQCVVEAIRRQYDNPEDGKGILAGVSDEIECVLVLGGDGTMIQVADALSGRDIPLVGINLGHIGYLAEVELGNVIGLLNRLMEGSIDIEERMMLSGCVCTSGNVHAVGDAINDIVITRSGSLRILNFDIYVNDKMLSTYSADGIIISTPTGSTGYNMSAGGPIVEPDADLIVLTPICPHNLAARSIVLSPEDDVRVELAGGCEYDLAEVSFDGGSNVKMRPGDYVSVCRSDNKTKMIKMSRLSFVEVLSKKMSAEKL